MTQPAATPIAVGTALPPLIGPKLTRTVLALFAGASNDHNPIHIDLDAARGSGQSDVFAQGMLCMALVGRCVTTWAPQKKLRSLKARFVAITPVNAEPVVTGVVTRIGSEHLTVALEVTLADGTITITAEAEIDVKDGYPCT